MSNVEVTLEITESDSQGKPLAARMQIAGNYELLHKYFKQIAVETLDRNKNEDAQK